ncbi:MAG: hypothetical protein ACRD6X_11360 [Pyrinomonadaceae bacterium]
MNQLHAFQQAIGEFWIPTIYETKIRKMRTRSFELAVPERENSPEIMHTLLGVELKIGRKRMACPDLSTARYLQIFARIGCRNVAVPYDITVISSIADELETAWHRTVLIIEEFNRDSTPQAKGRMRSQVIRAMREEIAKIGAGTNMPLFNKSTKQRED